MTRTRRLVPFTHPLLAAAFALVVVWSVSDDAQAVVSESALTIMSITAGLVIAAAGVFLGTLGTLLTAARMDVRLSRERLDRFEAHLNDSAREVKENVVFSLMAVPVVMLIEMARRHWEHWTFAQPGMIDLTVNQASTWLALTLLFLTLVATKDSIGVMFTVYEMLRELRPPVSNGDKQAASPAADAEHSTVKAAVVDGLERVTTTTEPANPAGESPPTQ